MRQYLGSHADGDAFGPLSEEHRELGGKNHRLLVASVVRGNVWGKRFVEEGFLGQGREAALDVARGSGGVSRVDIAEIALFLDKKVLVCEDD